MLLPALPAAGRQAGRARGCAGRQRQRCSLLELVPALLRAAPLQNDELAEREAALAGNISALFNTAKLELARKDADIKDLRQQ